MKKYRSFETMFRSLRDELCTFLKKSGIYYELSGCYGGWHFEVLCNENEAGKINTWLDENTITEK